MTDYRAGAHDGARTNENSGHDEGTGAYKGVFPDSYFTRLQRPGRVVKTMSARAKVGFLGYNCVRADFNFTQAVSISAVAQAGAVMHGKTPGDLNARPLVHEGQAMDFGAEYPEPKQPPGIKRFRSPHAK